jgi:hypothetical protein
MDPSSFTNDRKALTAEYQADQRRKNKDAYIRFRVRKEVARTKRPGYEPIVADPVSRQARLRCSHDLVDDDHVVR